MTTVEHNAILHEDALTCMKRCQPSSIPLIITDPPYGIGYHSNYYKERNPHAPIQNDWNFQIGPFLQACERILANGGALYICSRWDVTPVWMAALQQTNLKLKTIIIWVKNNWSAGDLEGSFGNQYEQLLFITKGRHLLRGKRWSNVWNFPRVPAPQLLHPAQKPVGLYQRAIEASSDKGDLVLDPYMGSGTTAEACKYSGRDFLCCDIDRRMVALARRRVGIPDGYVEEEDTSMRDLAVYQPGVPSLEEWGIHPEQLLEVMALLRHNQEELLQQPLFGEEAM